MQKLVEKLEAAKCRYTVRGNVVVVENREVTLENDCFIVRENGRVVRDDLNRDEAADFVATGFLSMR